MEIVGIEDHELTPRQVLSVINPAEKQAAKDKSEYANGRIKENSKKLVDMISHLDSLSKERGDNGTGDSSKGTTLLMKKKIDAIAQFSVGDNLEEHNNSYPILIRRGVPENMPFEPIELPKVEKIPPYTTWIHSKRSQKTTEDQPVMAKTRIYCDDVLGHADNHEEKSDSKEAEDIIIRNAIKGVGFSDVVQEPLAKHFRRSVGEVEERYETLSNEENGNSVQDYLDNDHDKALDSFDKLFCRQCYVFDCQLHGYCQDLFFPAEKQSPWAPPDEEITPCGPHCYKLVLNMGKKNKLDGDLNNGPSHTGGGVQAIDLNEPPTQEDIIADDSLRKGKSPAESEPEGIQFDAKTWRTLEKSLFNKGLEIFGRNSCLIARNILSGMKTCQETFQFIKFFENKPSSEAGDASDTLIKEDAGVDADNATGIIEACRRSRILRRKDKIHALKLKKSAVFSTRKKIGLGENGLLPQYHPCNCKASCEERCPCREDGTCCEKYCGCPKICKNRFRGCHCAKKQCRSQQCPCFAADRECDPDLCRNCLVSCGDGSIGAPSQRDNKGCNNMKILLKQQQRVLLGKSSVTGWGAFLKNSVDKDEYIGEYTGEVISHDEADMRSKNSSFLFDLNNEFVIDACRIGNKMKFANHSPNPNCYAKVIMVCGDQRIGIFSKDKIAAGEELFYDYHYDPALAPDWAKNEAGASSSGHPAKKRI